MHHHRKWCRKSPRPCVASQNISSYCPIPLHRSIHRPCYPDFHERQVNTRTRCCCSEDDTFHDDAPRCLFDTSITEEQTNLRSPDELDGDPNCCPFDRENELETSNQNNVNSHTDVMGGISRRQLMKERRKGVCCKMKGRRHSCQLHERNSADQYQTGNHWWDAGPAMQTIEEIGEQDQPVNSRSCPYNPEEFSYETPFSQYANTSTQIPNIIIHVPVSFTPFPPQNQDHATEMTPRESAIGHKNGEFQNTSTMDTRKMKNNGNVHVDVDTGDESKNQDRMRETTPRESLIGYKNDEFQHTSTTDNSKMKDERNKHVDVETGDELQNQDRTRETTPRESLIGRKSGEFQNTSSTDNRKMKNEGNKRVTVDAGDKLKNNLNNEAPDDRNQYAGPLDDDRENIPQSPKTREEIGRAKNNTDSYPTANDYDKTNVEDANERFNCRMEKCAMNKMPELNTKCGPEACKMTNLPAPITEAKGSQSEDCLCCYPPALSNFCCTGKIAGNCDCGR